jgi:hypothetical protein
LFVLFALHFYRIGADGDRTENGRQMLHIDSIEDAKRCGHAVIRNILIDGRQVNICAIKKSVGEASHRGHRPLTGAGGSTVAIRSVWTRRFGSKSARLEDQMALRLARRSLASAPEQKAAAC